MTRAPRATNVHRHRKTTIYCHSGQPLSFQSPRAAISDRLFFGWLGNLLIRVRQQRQIVAQITSVGGRVSYDYGQAAANKFGDRWQNAPPPGPKIIRALFGDDVYAYVSVVDFNYHRSQFEDTDLKCLASLPPLADRFFIRSRHYRRRDDAFTSRS